MLKGLFVVIVCVFMIANIVKISLDVYSARKMRKQFENLKVKDKK